MRLLFVSNLLIFCVQLASGVLPKHAIREISGLDKANRFVLPVTANGKVSSEPFPNISQPCKDAFFGLITKRYTQLIRCKYDLFIFAMFCLQVNYLITTEHFLKLIFCLQSKLMVKLWPFVSCQRANHAYFNFHTVSWSLPVARNFVKKVLCM